MFLDARERAVIKNRNFTTCRKQLSRLADLHIASTCKDFLLKKNLEAKRNCVRNWLIPWLNYTLSKMLLPVI